MWRIVIRALKALARGAEDDGNTPWRWRHWQLPLLCSPATYWHRRASVDIGTSNRTALLKLESLGSYSTWVGMCECCGILLLCRQGLWVWAAAAHPFYLVSDGKHKQLQSSALSLKQMGTQAKHSDAALLKPTGIHSQSFSCCLPEDESKPHLLHSSAT